MNVRAAQADLQRAYGALINRFGLESDIIGWLTSAINNLKEDQETKLARLETSAVSVMGTAPEVTSITTGGGGSAPVVAPKARRHGRPRR